MRSRRLIAIFAVALLAAGLSLAVPRAGGAQSGTGSIRSALDAVVKQRIPAVKDTEWWGYRLPVASKYEKVGGSSCPGEFVHLYGIDPTSGQRDLWGAIAIQQCATEDAASAMMQSFQPDYVKILYPNAGINFSSVVEWRGMEARSIGLIDTAYDACSAPLIEEYREYHDDCEKIPSKSHVRREGTCEYWMGPGKWGLRPCVWYVDPGAEERFQCHENLSFQLRGALYDGCSGSDTWAANIDMWRSGNYVFLAQQPTPEVISLSTVLAGCPDCPSLKDMLREEADKAGLTASVSQAPASQPPAAGLDTDQDGFADTRDLCRTQPAPQSADGCPPYSVIIQCGPEEPEEGETIACTAEAGGSPDGDTVEFEWEVDGKPQASGVASQWTAGKSSHTVTVRARGKPSGKQGTSTITILIRGAITKPVDDPTSNIVITNLGCSTDITSDESMDCLVGFKRLDSNIKELVVIWHVDGKRASTSTRMDDGDTYSLSQPAPGVHTIMVFAGDPNNAGRGRVMTTTARILPGLNAQKIPAGAGAGAAAGTLLGIGGWLWAQWWFAKQGSGPVSKAISRLPTSPRVDRSYSGSDAKKILEQLGIYDGMKGLDSSDFTDPEFRARLEELLDTRFGKRRVKGVHYKVGTDGEIDINSIEIVVEEAEDTLHPRDVRPPAPTKKARPPVKPSVTKPPVTLPPKTKPPVKVPPVDPIEEKLRKRWKDEQRDFVDKQRDLRTVNAARRVATNEHNKVKAQLAAERDSREKRGYVDVGAFMAQAVYDVGKAALGIKLPSGMNVVENLGFNLVRNIFKDSYSTEKSTGAQLVWKSLGLQEYRDSLGAANPKLPGGLPKDLLQAVLQWKKIEDGVTALKTYGYGTKIRNFLAENAQHTAKIDGILQKKGQLFNGQLELEVEHIKVKAERDSAQRHVQYAWDAYQEYLRNKRAAGKP